MSEDLIGDDRRLAEITRRSTPSREDVVFLLRKLNEARVGEAKWTIIAGAVAEQRDVLRDQVDELCEVLPKALAVIEAARLLAEVLPATHSLRRAIEAFDAVNKGRKTP